MSNGAICVNISCFHFQAFMFLCPFCVFWIQCLASLCTWSCLNSEFLCLLCKPRKNTNSICCMLVDYSGIINSHYFIPIKHITAVCLIFLLQFLIMYFQQRSCEVYCGSKWHDWSLLLHVFSVLFVFLTVG
jgi:hypothetical protein